MPSSNIPHTLSLPLHNQMCSNCCYQIASSPASSDRHCHQVLSLVIIASSFQCTQTLSQLRLFSPWHWSPLLSIHPFVSTSTYTHTDRHRHVPTAHTHIHTLHTHCTHTAHTSTHLEKLFPHPSHPPSSLYLTSMPRRLHPSHHRPSSARDCDVQVYRRGWLTGGWAR